jgi:hypothetical protein
MPSAHGLTVTASITDPGALGAAIAAFGRRSVAQRLRRQGEQALLLGQQYAGELGPSRSGNRRRDKGVSFRNGFKVEYSGLDDAGAGRMFVKVQNRSRHARVLEVGAKAHDIPVGKKGMLAWPIPYNAPGPIAVVARRTVKHRGFGGHHILKRAAEDSMRNGFTGRVIAHANITITVGGRR